MASKGRTQDGAPVDLGLTELLQTVEGEEAGREPPVVSEVSRAASEIGPEGVTPTTPQSDYERLAGALDWRGLAALCERSLHENHGNVEARLWWILAQAELKTLPTALLLAPLEEALQSVSSSEAPDPALSRLATEVSERVRGGKIVVPAPSAGGSGSNRPVVEPASLRDPVEFAAARPVSSARKLARLLLGTAAVVTVCIIGAIVWHYVLPRVATTIARLPIEVGGPGPALVVPGVHATSGMGSLSGIFYDMSSSPTAVPANPSAVPVATAVEPAASDAAVPVKLQEVQPEPTRKASKIDVTGPLEPPEVRRRVSAPPKSDNGRRADRDPFSRSPGDPIPPREAIREGSVYEILVQTTVLSEPSIYGRVIGRLEAGDRVKIDAHLGRWVRLVGSRGRPGFLLAQDIGGEVRP